MASQQQVSNTPEASRDSWQTPQWLFDWADNLFHFTIDLASSENNAKCDKFLTIDDDSLSVDWHLIGQHPGGYSYERGWCNPPYSDPGTWLAKGWKEAQEGFFSAYMVPTPNGESYWDDSVFGKASDIIYITGRIAFVASSDFVIKGKKGKPDRIIKAGQEVPGNTRGSCLVVFNRRYEGFTAPSYVKRDDIKEQFGAIW